MFRGRHNYKNNIRFALSKISSQKIRRIVEPCNSFIDFFVDSSDTLQLPLRTLDTVATETPASLATSFIVMLIDLILSATAYR